MVDSDNKVYRKTQAETTKNNKTRNKTGRIGRQKRQQRKQRAIAGSRVNIGINNGSENNCKNKPNKPNNNRNKVDPNL